MGSDDRDMTMLTTLMRDVYVREPEPEVSERHLAMILDEVAVQRAEAVTTPLPRVALSRSRRTLVLRRAGVVASAFLACAGLAVAGVRPPEPAADLFESIGFDVPGSDRDSDEKVAPQQSKPDEAGSNPGGADSSDGGGADTGAPTGNGGGQPGGENRGPSDGRANGDSQGRGAENSAEGQDTAEQAQSGSTPPSDPGRSEDAPAASPAPGPPSNSQAGGGEAPPQAQGSPPEAPQSDAPGQTGQLPAGPPDRADPVVPQPEPPGPPDHAQNDRRYQG